MIHLANILVVMAGGERARALHAALLAESFDGPLIEAGAEALEQAQARRPDVLVVGEDPSDMPAAELVRAVRDDPQTRDIPIFFLKSEWRPDDLQALLALGVDDALPQTADRAMLAARLRPLVRLSTMQAELVHRAASADRFGLPVSDHVDAPSERPQVLIAGDADDVAAVREVAGPGMDMTATDSLFEADDLVARRMFECLVIGVGVEVDAALDICAQIRRNPRLFNLPVILLAEPEALGEPARPYVLGASQVLSRRPEPTALRWALTTLVRRQQRRWAIRRAFDRTRLPALLSRDLPDLYTGEFLTAYLNDRIAAARREGKPLSVIRFSFGGVARVEEEFGTPAGNHLRHQLGQWITSLVRAEDLAAHLGGTRFAVALPDTPLEEAQVVMQRIAGVIGYTDFAVQDVYQVVKVWPHVGAAAWTGADTAATLLERAEAAAD